MSDLISRQAIRDWIEWYDEENFMHPGYIKTVHLLEKLEKLPSAEAEQQKWIPVTERLPEIGIKVLVFAYGNDILTARMHKQKENGYPVFECNGIYLEMAKHGRITHWMPLPEPPKEEKA